MSSIEDMDGPDGLWYKVNPALREVYVVKELNETLREGKIDWIETDHAPHSAEEKSLEGGIFMSGIPSLCQYKELLAKLGRDGISDRRIEELTYYNIKKVLRKIVE